MDTANQTLGYPGVSKYWKCVV